MAEENPESFTDFMIRSMTGEEGVVQALLIIRREDGTIGYRPFEQEVADTLGMLRFATLSVENDLLNSWRDE